MLQKTESSCDGHWSDQIYLVIYNVCNPQQSTSHFYLHVGVIKVNCQYQHTEYKTLFQSTTHRDLPVFLPFFSRIRAFIDLKCLLVLKTVLDNTLNFKTLNIADELMINNQLGFILILFSQNSLRLLKNQLWPLVIWQGWTLVPVTTDPMHTLVCIDRPTICTLPKLSPGGLWFRGYSRNPKLTPSVIQ